eukprot:TRINITY_DN177_c0_g2_i1.p1 TRINITY_DN177_c0_g2~~TRINITY_DN177_c0_g2_i1.p1  ORF type:complete len:202 (+),score=20.57 TRINITY_DN177_c0_g2_i1:382-987(+)
MPFLNRLSTTYEKRGGTPISIVSFSSSRLIRFAFEFADRVITRATLMASGDRYSGGCSCGAVKTSVDRSAEPMAQFWCHCSDCRVYYKLPIVPVVMWQEALGSIFKIVQGEEKLSKTLLDTSGKTERYFCRDFGEPVYNMVGGKILATRPTTMLEFPFKPQLHHFYKERKMQLHDGLPKYADKTASRGGSDKKLSETGQPL